MQAIVAQSLPGAKASIEFHPDGYPPMAPTAGNRALFGVLQAANRDLGLPEMGELDPVKRGAGDVSFVAADVDALAGLGPYSTGDHAPGEAVDIPSIWTQAKRAAILMSRLARREALGAFRSVNCCRCASLAREARRAGRHRLVFACAPRHRLRVNGPRPDGPIGEDVHDYSHARAHRARRRHRADRIRRARRGAADRPHRRVRRQLCRRRQFLRSWPGSTRSPARRSVYTTGPLLGRHQLYRYAGRDPAACRSTISPSAARRAGNDQPEQSGSTWGFTYEVDQFLNVGTAVGRSSRPPTARSRKATCWPCRSAAMMRALIS